MDALSDPRIPHVVVMSSAQVGKTSVGENLIGRHIHLDPCPILALQPTLEMAETFSKDRLAPMLRDTPVLHGLVAEARSRDSGNTMLHKQFRGGHITMAGSNSAASLASRPIRVLWRDERDRFAKSAGTEGNPASLAYKRTLTFWNRKILDTSTPTLEETSEIKREFERGDQRRYFVVCPLCQHEQVLVWRPGADGRGGVRWDRDPDGTHHPETARYYCAGCDQPWTDVQKNEAVRRGRWKATAVGKPGIASFHLWELYSTWSRMADMAATWIEATKFPDELQVVVNTMLGETWVGQRSPLDEESLAARAESYTDDPLPRGVCLLTAGVDCQDDRLEMEVVGWGRDFESWSIEYVTMPGDPSSPALWEMLDQRLQKLYTHPCGKAMKIAAACVDTGGHHTQQVYRFCGPRWARRVWAIKGASDPAKPIAGKPTMNNIAKIPLFTVGINAAKDLTQARLRIDQPGPGYCHFRADYGQDYFDGLASEHRRVRYHGGRPYSVWEKLPGRRRNEPWDCRNYATVAVEILNPIINAFAEQIERELGVQSPASTAVASAVGGVRRGRRVRSAGFGRG